MLYSRLLLFGFYPCDTMLEQCMLVLYFGTVDCRPAYVYSVSSHKQLLNTGIIRQSVLGTILYRIAIFCAVSYHIRSFPPWLCYAITC